LLISRPCIRAIRLLSPSSPPDVGQFFRRAPFNPDPIPASDLGDYLHVESFVTWNFSWGKFATIPNSDQEPRACDLRWDLLPRSLRFPPTPSATRRELAHLRASPGPKEYFTAVPPFPLFAPLSPKLFCAKDPPQSYPVLSFLNQLSSSLRCDPDL